MKKLMSFRSALILGGAGFIGSNWAARILKTSDARVHIFDNLSRQGVDQNLTWLRQQCDDPERLKITVADVRDAGAVARAMTSATEVYHFAAQVAVTSSVSNPRHDFEVNALGTLNVLEAARQSRRQPFILYTSTNKVYGNLTDKPLVLTGRRYCALDDKGVSELQPLDLHSPYGCSKGAADQYVRDYSRIFGLPSVVFRMSCIAGARQCGNEDQGWLAHFVYSALEGRPLTIFGDGKQVRDVLCIDDLLQAFEKVRANVNATAGQVYNVGGGPANSISLLEVIDEIESVIGKRIRFTLQRSRPGDQLFYITDFEKLRKHTGWFPRTSLRKTTEIIYQWWHERRAIAEPITMPAIPAAPLVQAPEAVR
ncbi:MAG TPA: GDP-mannose 4,6-dehydratase [Terriglobales bacterium]|jgi:CDP-paratose 2-epimerase